MHFKRLAIFAVQKAIGLGSVLAVKMFRRRIKFEDRAEMQGHRNVAGSHSRFAFEHIDNLGPGLRRLANTCRLIMGIWPANADGDIR